MRRAWRIVHRAPVFETGWRTSSFCAPAARYAAPDSLRHPFFSRCPPHGVVSLCNGGSPGPPRSVGPLPHRPSAAVHVPHLGPEPHLGAIRPRDSPPPPLPPPPH